MSTASSAFPIEHIYNLVVADEGRQRAFVCLAAMLISFFLIRTSARMTRAFTWWPGGVETEGGMHLHHFVWGIFLMLGSGFAGLGLHLGHPWGGIVAAIFGIFAATYGIAAVYLSQPHSQTVVIGDDAYVGPGNELLKGLRVWPGTRVEPTSVRFSTDA